MGSEMCIRDRITPRVLENAVAGSTAVRFSLPSVQEYVVSRAFWFILNAMYVRLVQRLRETRQKFTCVYETLCSCWSGWRCSFEVVEQVIPRRVNIRISLYSGINRRRRDQKVVSNNFFERLPSDLAVMCTASEDFWIEKCTHIAAPLISSREH